MPGPRARINDPLLIDVSSQLKLLLYISLIACVFAPWGLAPVGAGPVAHIIAAGVYLGKLAIAGLLVGYFLRYSLGLWRATRAPEAAAIVP